ncbi:MAG: antitoxin Xre/MbcA/ParS toxin-binding domain-containing protein [Ahrensia sp.]|nr:antitoxin Xre/MbcA/ParS toxin-binding domain-containing protein [Ahrensia sp.]
MKSLQATTRARNGYYRVKKINAIKLGIEIGRISELQKVGFKRHEIETIVASRRTLDRRTQKKEALSPDEADRVMRLERIHAHAMRVFGDLDKVSRWLRKPCRALDDAVPMDLLVSETGAHIVEQQLHAIDYGMFV